jgi:hypothetical protein
MPSKIHSFLMMAAGFASSHHQKLKISGGFASPNPSTAQEGCKPSKILKHVALVRWLCHRTSATCGDLGAASLSEPQHCVSCAIGKSTTLTRRAARRAS